MQMHLELQMHSMSNPGENEMKKSTKKILLSSLLLTTGMLFAARMANTLAPNDISGRLMTFAILGFVCYGAIVDIIDAVILLGQEQTEEKKDEKI